MARQREGDLGTFHYIDNLAKAVEFAGKIIVDLAPKIYDTARVARILGEDGGEEFAELDPSMPTAKHEGQDFNGKVRKIYNLSVGRYDLSVSTGPTYTTKRQESADFFTQLAQSDPTLMQKAGDIIVRNFDMPGAEELAERLKLFLPPNIAQAEGEEGQQIPPQIQAAMQQIEQANQMLDQKAQALQEMKAQLDQEGGTVAADKAQLQMAYERLQAETRELALHKQLAIKEIQLQQAKLQASADAAKAEIEELMEPPSAHDMESINGSETYL
jgi:Fe-S cluster biogenesis protein NfuA